MRLPYSPLRFNTSDPRCSRRDAVKAGALGLAGCAMLTRGNSSRGADAATLPYILVIYCSGGWDQSMVFDPKLASTLVTPESGAALAQAGTLSYVSHPNRPAVQAFFDARGANAAIVNGLYCNSLDHKMAFHQAFGAVPPGKLRPIDWLTFYAASLAPSLPMPHTVINAPFMPGASAPYAVRLTTESISDYLTDAPGGTLGDAGEAALTAFRKAGHAKSLESVHAESLDGEKLRVLDSGYQREPLIKAALTTADATLGAIGTDSTFLRQGKLAVELFAQGSSQAVTLQAGARDLWDTTTDNFTRQNDNYESLFSDLAKILTYADSRAIGENLLVVVASELGRAPLVNEQNGKGSWPYTSALLWGAGINGGVVAGLTDDALRGVPVDPVFGTAGGASATTLTLAHVFAAIYLKTGAPAPLLLPDTVKALSPIIKAA